MNEIIHRPTIEAVIGYANEKNLILKHLDFNHGSCTAIGVHGLEGIDNSFYKVVRGMAPNAAIDFINEREGSIDFMFPQIGGMRVFVASFNKEVFQKSESELMELEQKKKIAEIEKRKQLELKKLQEQQRSLNDQRAALRDS